MCNPALIVPLIIASTAVSTAGAISSSSATANAANYQAKVNDQNAALADQQARDSLDKTNIEAQRRYREQGQLKGQQEAALAANGVDLGFGSALSLQQDTAMIGAEDVGQIYKAGNERTRGYEISASNYRTEAQSNRYKASAAKTEGLFKAASSILGGASQLAGMKKS
jgi:hypothetical protein